MSLLKFGIIFFALLLFFGGRCQLNTSVSMSPLGLVQNVLLGPGVTVSNISFNGSPTAIGAFAATGTNLGIAQGIVMTTGTVLNTGAGPQGPNNQAGAGMDNNMGGSAMLTGLLNGTQTYNASILEFDFIPYSDTVLFKYVFGSDEYPEFAPPNSSGFNDVFGFFISGPGIIGIENIAKLPTNGSIVSINNVNSITNSSFFNFNGDGNSPPYNGNPFYIQYDGFTDVLEAVSKVQCGETYHLVIAIADVGDGEWDSGIFLEANSLSSQTPVAVDYVISDTLFNSPSIMAEGCVSSIITLSRQDNINSSLTIPIQVNGTATAILDYSGIPSSVTFLPGDSTISFTINALADLLTEGSETISMDFLLTDPCGNITPINLTLTIQDIQPINVQINDPIVLCPGDNITLVASVTGGLQPYSYLWNDGQTSSSITLSPTTTGFYTVSVSGQCSNNLASDSVLVSVPVFQPLQMTVSNDVTEICPYIPTTFYSIVTGGSGSYSYSWSTTGNSISSSDSIIVTPSTSSTYFITVQDGCGSTLSDTISYFITSPPLLTSVNNVPEICPGDSAYISVSAVGGYGNYHYYWALNGDTTNGIWVNPTGTSTYLVEVSDDCQTFSIPTLAQVTVVKPDANFSVSSLNLIEGLPISFQNLTTNGYVYDWYFSDGGYSDLVHPTHTFNPAGDYLITLVATDAKGCVDSITKPIHIFEEFYIYIPNTFFPDEDRINEYFAASFIGVKSAEIYIYNRWGELVFESLDKNFRWDGKYKGEKVQQGTYSWLLKYKRNGTETEILTGHINVLR